MKKPELEIIKKIIELCPEEFVHVDWSVEMKGYLDNNHIKSIQSGNQIGIFVGYKLNNLLQKKLKEAINQKRYEALKKRMEKG